VTTLPSGYPRELEHAATLPDGATVRIRPIRPDDADRLIELYRRLGEYTAYQRFFRTMRELPPDWARMLATVDYERRLALVAEAGAPASGELIAVASYEPSGDEDTAEVAFVVQDSWQGRGLGSILLRDLVQAAGARGISQFRAYVLPDNRRMLDLLERLTEVQQRRLDAGVLELRFVAQPGTAGPGPA
jgi:RimJ/RimL family protein N-acetyltransferase